MMQEHFDLIVIGSGAAAFAAALRASELGAATALVERGTLGGTCVNVGCVPSKTLLRAAEALHRARHTPFHGLAVTGMVKDFGEVMAQKRALVNELRQRKYADVLDRLQGVELIRGEARFVANNVIVAGGRRLVADRIVVATGARASVPSISGLADVGFLTSTEALDIAAPPQSLLILGGGFVGVELAQLFARFGTRVTIVQRGPRLLSHEDADVSEALAACLRAEGIEILTSSVAERMRREGDFVVADVGGHNSSVTLVATAVLVATGRRPNSDTLSLDTVGVRVAPGGGVEVDAQLQTSVSGIYAAGDVTGVPMFVYTAAYDGRLAAENALTGATRKRDFGAVPRVLFTDPQVACVGISERTAGESGVLIDVARLSLSQIPRALAARDTRGFIKLIKARGGNELLGAAIVAPEAGEIVMQPAMAIQHGIGVTALAAQLQPYLTLSEGIRLAAQLFTRDPSMLSCCAA